MAYEIKKAAVIGSGTMGGGIASPISASAILMMTLIKSLMPIG